MNKELEIWQFAAEKLKQNEALILLVVVESSGSSPGRQGFKMIVSADEMRGSIGGGVMEVALVEQARFKIQDSGFKIDSEIIEQVHRKNSVHSSGMICSGKQTVILRKLTEDDFKTVRNIIRHLKRNDGRYLQITENKFQTGWHKRSNFNFNFTINDSRILEAHIRQSYFIDGKSVLEPQIETTTKVDVSGVSTFLYEEKLGFKNKLFIIGGGHCALALSELMARIDFHISLFGDREDLNTLAKNDFVHEKKIIESYEQISDFIESGENIYVVVMTLGYKFDEIVIRKLFDRNFKYFGVLGSKAKIKVLLKTLEKEGFDKERLAKIRTPIGLPINSRTPGEIAVSIAAEIIAVKNG